jgi:serine/threonine protein kinase
MMAIAGGHGVPVPAVREVRADALVLEFVPGGTLTDAVRRRPWTLPTAVRTIAELHELVHAVPYRGGRLVHFDLHPDNVLMSPGGPTLIDWTNAHGGEPDEDVALTWLIAATSAGPGGRIFAARFRHVVGAERVRRGFPGARAYRLADPHVTDTERAAVDRLRP